MYCKETLENLKIMLAQVVGSSIDEPRATADLLFCTSNRQDHWPDSQYAWGELLCVRSTR